jgi:hypothetical protein
LVDFQGAQQQKSARQLADGGEFAIEEEEDPFADGL